MAVPSSSSDRPAARAAGARAEPLIGVAFAVLFFVAFNLSNTPDNEASDAKWTNYFASSGNRTSLIVSGFLFVVAALCLLWFLTMLWSRIAAAQRPESLNPLPLAAATVAAAAIAIGGVLNAVVAGAMAFGSSPEPSPDILRFADNLGYPVIAVAGMFATALAIAGLSLQARRVGVFGKGLTTFGVIVALITLASFLFFPMLLMLIWFLVVGVVLSRRDPAGR
jgi:hypothetical protein